MQAKTPFGEKVEEVLTSLLKISGREAARRTGLSNTTIVDMRGGRVPSRDVVRQFAEGLGLPVEEWLEAARYERLRIRQPAIARELRDIGYRLLTLAGEVGEAE